MDGMKISEKIKMLKQVSMTGQMLKQVQHDRPDAETSSA